MTSLPSGLGPVPPPGCPAHQPAHDPLPLIPSLYGPQFASDPAATYAWLRAQGPAHPVELAPASRPSS